MMMLQSVASGLRGWVSLSYSRVARSRDKLRLYDSLPGFQNLVSGRRLIDLRLTRGDNSSKRPPRRRFHVVLGVLVLAKRDFWLDAKHAAARGFNQRQELAPVFLIVNVRHALPLSAVGNLNGGALEYYGFVGFLRSDDT